MRHPFLLQGSKTTRDAPEDALAVPGADGARRGLGRHLRGETYHGVLLPPRLLGRRGAEVPRFRHDVAAGR